MAVLSNADRAAVWASLMSLFSSGEPITVLKADLRAAVDAADSWADSNAASYNSALPLPARTSLSAKQKAALLMEVVKRRYVVN